MSRFGAVQNLRHTQEFVWDFAVDGGGTGAIDLGDLPLGAVVVNAVGVVETACTSGGSATVILGTTDDDNGFIASVAVAALGANTTHGNSVATNQPKTNDDASRDVVMTIGTAALTAGKIRFILEYYIPSNVTQSE
jgi:hypothetical protein